MIRPLLDWLDNRTGYRSLTKEALFENIPGGSRWRYVWGSTLTFGLAIQFITGVFLWMGYSASSQTAWESVYYIQHEMMGGWFLRGLHHWTAQIMTVLLVLHLMQVVIDGAYKAPREVNFWFGVILLQLVLALSLTGYLLPWDQKGYWATKVATNLMALVPIIGDDLQKIVIGGSDYGHHTITRFFALHAGILPAAVIGLVVGHIYLFRRHGITPAKPLRKKDEFFWPEQVLKDAIACLAVLATVMFLTIRFHGAHLSSPADPSEPFSAARPDWYFMFLFQLLKYFPGSWEILGAIILPGLVMLVIFLIPYIGKWELGHRFNIGMLVALLAGVGLLTYLAIAEDNRNPMYVAAVKQAVQDEKRVIELAKAPAGIPSSGAVTLLREDPKTQGPRLFVRNCASCHRYDGHDGMGVAVNDPQSASDLKNFGTRQWLAGLLDPAKVDSAHYFGGTRFKAGKMVKFVKSDVAEFTPEMRTQLYKVVLALSAEAKLGSQSALDAKDASLIEEGKKLVISAEMNCTECHSYREEKGGGTGPDLTGWASREWLVDFISNAKHARFYGKRNDRMPAFGADHILDQKQIGLIADWLRGNWHEPSASSSR